MRQPNLETGVDGIEIRADPVANRLVAHEVIHGRTGYARTEREAACTRRFRQHRHALQAVSIGQPRRAMIISSPTLDDIMTVTEPFRVSRSSDAPWVVLAGGSMTGGGVSFGEARLPAQTSGPSYHLHENEDEAAYVVDGTMTFRVGDETFEAGPGTLVWLPRGVPHTFANLSDGPVWVFGTISPAGLEGMFAEQAEYFASLTGPPDESRIDEIGARWGVTRIGPPLGAPNE